MRPSRSLVLVFHAPHGDNASHLVSSRQIARAGCQSGTFRRPGCLSDVMSSNFATERKVTSPLPKLDLWFQG